MSRLREKVEVVGLMANMARDSKNIRVGINGMGRIGRTIIRQWASRSLAQLEIVACNNPGIQEHYAHLLKYDSVHGLYPGSIESQGNQLFVDGKELSFFNDSEPDQIPWSEKNVDVVIDGSGVFKDRASLGRHLGGSVKKVIMCAPGKDLDATFVMGVNHDTYQPQHHHVISNASCTTNCLAPVVKVLQDNFVVESGFMTTIHAYTLDQVPLDSSHQDMRRARAAALNMIPTTTGAAKMVGEVLPALKGKLDGHAIRVPVANVSLVDFSVNLEKTVSAQDIHEAIKEAANTSPLKGILAHTDLPLVSQDFLGRRESAIYDTLLTKVMGSMAKMTIWYDNEVGFSNRVLDLACLIGKSLKGD